CVIARRLDHHWFTVEAAIRVKPPTQCDDWRVAAAAGRGKTPACVEPAFNDTVEHCFLASRELLVAAVRGAERRALGLGRLEGQWRRGWCTLVRDLVEQGGDPVGVEL